MANYVDYGYWVQGYGEGDLSQPDRYVVVGYWVDGYAEYENESSVAVIDGTATVVANALRIKLGSAAITGNAQFEVNTQDIIIGTDSFDGVATVTANGSFVSIGSAAITGDATFSALGGVIYGGIARVNGTSTLDVISVSGFEWVDVTPEADDWSDVSPNSGTWQTQSPETNTWVRQ